MRRPGIEPGAPRNSMATENFTTKPPTLVNKLFEPMETTDALVVEGARLILEYEQFAPFNERGNLRTSL